jgi:hypothetical protein
MEFNNYSEKEGKNIEQLLDIKQQIEIELKKSIIRSQNDGGNIWDIIFKNREVLLKKQFIGINKEKLSLAEMGKKRYNDLLNLLKEYQYTIFLLFYPDEKIDFLVISLTKFQRNRPGQEEKMIKSCVGLALIGMSYGDICANLGIRSEEKINSIFGTFFKSCFLKDKRKELFNNEKIMPKLVILYILLKILKYRKLPIISLDDLQKYKEYYDSELNKINKLQELKQEKQEKLKFYFESSVKDFLDYVSDPELDNFFRLIFGNDNLVIIESDEKKQWLCGFLIKENILKINETGNLVINTSVNNNGEIILDRFLCPILDIFNNRLKSDSSI